MNAALQKRGLLNSRVLMKVAITTLAALVVLTMLSRQARAEIDWPSCLERVAPSVVLIEGKINEEETSYGSGALIKSDGYILTACHVIKDAVSINVYVPESRDGEASYVRYEASIVASSTDTDIALLKIAATGLPSLLLGDSDDLRLEEEIRLLGYPQQAAGIGLIIGRGVFLGTRMEAEDVELIQIDVSPFDHGHSGGPVINAAGEIVGVAVKTWTGSEEGAETNKLAVSINTAKRLIPGSVLGSTASPTGVQLPSHAPLTWEIYGFSNKYLFAIPGDPTVGYPTPMPIRLPVEWGGMVVVGPDGLLYCTDAGKRRIVCFDPHTQESSIIFERKSLYPADLTFDLDGNLIFSTYARDGDNDGDSMGIWMIPGALPGTPAEKIIDGSKIRSCGVLVSGCRFGPPHISVLTAGPYRGDLLVSGRGDTAIARAVGPDYGTILPFIQQPVSSYPSGEKAIPTALSDFHAVTSTGIVLATDFINGRILRFDAEGRYTDVFCVLSRANCLTADSAGNVYASGSVWGSMDRQSIAGFSPDGTLLFQIPIGDVVGVVIVED
jgi:hypothetical protein